MCFPLDKARKQIPRCARDDKRIQTVTYIARAPFTVTSPSLHPICQRTRPAGDTTTRRAHSWRLTPAYSRQTGWQVKKGYESLTKGQSSELGFLGLSTRG